MSTVVMLMHGVGNPDFNQWGDVGPLVKMELPEFDEETFKEAFRWYNQEHDMGGGNCGWDHGIVLKFSVDGNETGFSCLGRFSYNGRWWPYNPDVTEEVPCFNPPKEAIAEAIKSLLYTRRIPTYDQYRKEMEDAYAKFLAEVEAKHG